MIRPQHDLSPPPEALPPGTAVYACRPECSRGRIHEEPESPTRSCFQRDRDRIIHSGAFRRLKYKTQVFVYHEGDYYRTRLSHSIEVAQIARSIARALGLNEDLAEALALAHDLGHTPFGHAGEKALNAAMAPYGGFDHNEQAFRVLTALEQRYAEFDGLNLTWETLEGTVKHNGPLLAGDRPAEEAVPASIKVFCDTMDLELGSQPSAEAQTAALADDIAYNNHDIDDGLRAALFSLDDLAEVPLVGPVLDEVRARYPGIAKPRLIHESIRCLITLMVNDLLAETGRRLAETAPSSAEEVRALARPVVAFSAPMRENDRALKAFLFKSMYRHHRVNRMTAKAERVITDLFEQYMRSPQCLPEEWQSRTRGPDAPETARAVADYIAGMTDRYALEEHRKLFDLYAKT